MASQRAAHSLSRSIVRLSPSVHLPGQSRRCALLYPSILSPQASRYPSERLSMPRVRQPKRHFTTTLVARKDDASSPPAADNASTLYSFSDISSLSSAPSPNRILIDVREVAELQSTGHIPTAKNIPITSAGDAFFLGAEEFEDRFGFAKPTAADEVIFYCKAGVRSKAAARIAQQAGFGGKVGEFPGSWVEWVENGGKIERS